MNQLGLFAKFWEPGRVKTRLASDIGSVRACKIYEAFVRHLLDKFAQIGDRRVLAFSPPGREREFAAAVGDNWVSQPQCEGDLGQRMAGFFEQACGSPGSTESQIGGNFVVLIGTDSPHLAPATIEKAFDRLRECDIVLGPCPDGGYYLVGMKKPDVGIFTSINWSSELVFEQTIERCQALNLTVAVLPEVIDIDHLSDLRKVRESVENGPTCPLDRKLFEMVDRVLADPKVEP